MMRTTTTTISTLHMPARPAKNYITVDFWLKPYLHAFVQHITGSTTLEVNSTNAIGAMALACLTPKPHYADKTGEVFQRGRVKLVANITVRRMKDDGHMVHRLSHFEDLVEHMFYHMLLMYVDTQGDEGVEQNTAIRRFMELHGIDGHGIELDSLKKTVIRRRKRMEVLRTK